MEVILSLGHALLAIVCTLVAVLYAKAVPMGHVNATMLALLGFFGGYFMCAVATKVVASAVATVYVCFAEDPDELQVS